MLKVGDLIEIGTNETGWRRRGRRCEETGRVGRLARMVVETVLEIGPRHRTGVHDRATSMRYLAYILLLVYVQISLHGHGSGQDPIWKYRRTGSVSESVICINWLSTRPTSAPQKSATWLNSPYCRARDALDAPTTQQNTRLLQR